ncbi:MAG: hypothetical protein RI894_2579 [Bacteroidota bacterium]|jgi:peptidylprolyl isomerase
MNKSTILTLVTGALLSVQATISFAQMQEFQKVPTRDAAIEKYIADNNIQHVKGSPDGFYYVIDKEGTGEFPQVGKEVFVHYVGTRLDGKKFDSSRDRGQPFSFPLGQGRVIKGWDKGIPLFREGSRGKLFLPPAVAYGERGAGGDIPANTPLIFDIEVFGGADLARIKEESAGAAAKAQAEAAKAQAEAAATAKATEGTRLADYVKAYPAKVFKQTADGMYYSIENEGTAPKPKTGDKVIFHFVGKFVDGRELGDSHKNGSPLTITIGENQMLPGGGFDKAFQLLGKGGKGQFVMPSGSCLGAQGAQGIPPYSSFVFDLEVIDILDAAAAKAQIEVLKKGQQTEIETFAKANNMQLKTLPSGLNYVIETEGTGAQAQAGKTVSVHYTGKLLNGTKFDSSVDRGQPIEFPLGVGQVIKGWDEGIALFKVGGKGKLLIPSYLAYGEQGSPPVISPNSVLVFDIELVNVK